MPRAPRLPADWIRRDPQSGAMERIEAYFHGHGYDPHRHATYAIGRTLAGVQSFHYRGELRHSLPGRTIVLHPDEVHDGHAGTEAGFHYRMVYLEPALLQQALGGAALPFIEGGISADPRLYAATEALVRRMDQRLDPLAQDDALYELAAALQAASGARRRRHATDFRAAERARQCIDDTLGQAITLDGLAAASGRDRWSLARDFRALYGVSPSRYVQARRLEWARRLMLAGCSLADAAAQANFADQSHLTRSFRSTYGMPPAAWLRMLAGRPAALSAARRRTIVQDGPRGRRLRSRGYACHSWSHRSCPCLISPIRPPRRRRAVPSISPRSSRASTITGRRASSPN